MLPKSDKNTRIAIQKLRAGIYQGLTPNRLLSTGSSNNFVSTDLVDWVTGTANEINIADDGDGTITVGIVDPLIVAKGGSGASSLTDHGLLLGSGTSAITALAEASNGQIPIGSTGNDPVLAGITGTSNQITVTNGAGSITLSTPQDIATSSNPTFAGFTKIGGASDYLSVDSGGDLTFVGGAGLSFGEIYAYEQADELTISGTGIANKIQITTFTTNGQSNNTTPDYTNDHITITTAGKYLVMVSVSLESVAAGGADNIGISVFKNNGATQFQNLHSNRTLAGGAVDYGSVSISGIIDVSVDDTIEVWLWNYDSTDNVIVDDINLSLVQIGG